MKKRDLGYCARFTRDTEKAIELDKQLRKANATYYVFTVDPGTYSFYVEQAHWPIAHKNGSGGSTQNGFTAPSHYTNPFDETPVYEPMTRSIDL